MKMRLSLICFGVLAFACSPILQAQVTQSLGDAGGFYPQDNFQVVSGDLYRSGGRSRGTAGQAGRPGRIWLNTNYADRGLGYRGAYSSLGIKTRLFEDRFDGRWLFEGRGHYSHESGGGFFGNFGIERVFSVDAAGADVSLGAWYDYDGDTQADFSHRFHAVGATAQIKTQQWDLIANGYFPVGVQSYTYGDLTGHNCFVNNRIVVVPGIDSALEGFDVTLRLRPRQLAMINGTIDIGGYQYSSDLINAFGGGRIRFGFQMLKGMLVSTEINQDDRFDTTGVVSVGWLFGANASGRGHEYSRVGRDLERTLRNDHIVRFNQDVVLAIDPATGLPYNVIHVDNTADPAFENGSAETPFNELLDAQVASGPGDVIYVDVGDGTDRNMDHGIVLQDNQKLWGSGVVNYIPIQGGQFFRLCNNPGGGRPTISNAGQPQVILLANNNDVSGINVDATGAGYGIFGNGNGGTIRDTNVFNSISDGIRLAGVTGNWNLFRNTVTNSGRDGIYVLNALDPTSVFNLTDNTVTGSVFDGIHFENFDPILVNLVDNTTNNNVRHGLFLENYINSTGNGVINIIRHTSDGNLGNGILALNGNGSLNFFNLNVTNNISSGVVLDNWTNTMANTVVFGKTAGGTSNISNNGGSANLEVILDNPGSLMNLLVTGQTLNNGTRGLSARVAGISGGGVQSRLNVHIMDNDGIANNRSDGILLSALDGGVIASLIGTDAPGQTDAILNNAGNGTAGIRFETSGPIGQLASQNFSVIRNLLINNIDGPNQAPPLPPNTGISINATDNAKVDIAVSNVTIGDATAGDNLDTQTGVAINLDNTFNPPTAPLVNRVAMDDMTIFAKTGVRVNTGTETSADISLTDSSLVQSPGGGGGNGLVVNANGQATATGNTTMPDYPSDPTGATPGAPELVTDGVMDNLTRVLVQNNSIANFSNDGVLVSTRGDAELLFILNGNRVTGNGLGNGAVPFLNGARLAAFDDSTLTSQISGNLFGGNAERGLALNTYQRATLNALVDSNIFANNDIGEDPNDTTPPVGTGIFEGPTGPITDAGVFDFEAINNEEYYFRPYESTILINGAGNPSDLAGVDLPNDTPGIPFPPNGAGVDIFGNPVVDGIATMNVAMTSNVFQLGVDIRDFSVAPGDFTLALDGLTNGFTHPFPGVTPGVFDFTAPIINGVETIFATGGFPSPSH